MTISTSDNFQDHPFHLVSPSIWPFFTATSIFGMATSLVSCMHKFHQGSYLLYGSLFLLIASMSFWFSDMISESTFLGDHTLAVQMGINMGVILFMVSEALFFMAIFWAFFHSSLTPTVELGAQWPPMGMEPVNPFELPLLNTVMLLSSGATMTYAHHALIKGDSSWALYGSLLTMILAFFFTAFQALEYIVSSFTISDGAFGACFFFGTGFHGFHVVVGTIFLSVGFMSMILYHLTDNHHSGLEAGILYWHFVDVVWLFLYLSVYYWGS